MTFHDFWTNENNPTLPKSEYLYNTRHILVLVGTVLACLILTLIFYIMDLIITKLKRQRPSENNQENK